MLVAHSREYNYVFILRVVDGYVINAFSYPFQSTYSNVNWRSRGIVVSSDSIPTIYLSNHYLPGTSVTGYRILSFPAVPFSASPTWAWVSKFQTSADQMSNLIFGESESYLYHLSYQSNKVLIMRLDSATGSVIWCYFFTQLPILTIAGANGLALGNSGGTLVAVNGKYKPTTTSYLTFAVI